MDSRPIGIIDAGMGGYTVVRQVQSMIPNEDIIYYGDSFNQPYGNRDKASILHMARQILDFMKGQNVKLVAIACNTISTLLEEFRDDYPFPIFSIVEAGAQAAVDSGSDKIGMISTVFTANSGCYQQLIRKGKPQAIFVPKGCQDLPRLIEHGNFDQDELDLEVRKEVDAVFAVQDVSHLILGCTHFGFVRKNIERFYPSLTVIDPAEEQGKRLKQFLEENNMLTESGKGNFRVFTTGSPERYREAAGRMTLYPPARVDAVSPPNPAPASSRV